MPNFKKGKVYRLTCDDPNLIYFGSTTMTLKKRFNCHKKENNTCRVQELFKVGGVEIELVLECPCESSKELREIEQTYIDNDNCINKINAILDKEHRKEYNRQLKKGDKYKESQRIYREKQKLKIETNIKEI
jgi:hypothetical protein